MFSKCTRAMAALALIAAAAIGISACGGGAPAAGMTRWQRTNTLQQESQLLQDRSLCEHPHGPFRISGNRILDGRGKRFIATGVTVYGLSLFGDYPRWNQDGVVDKDIKQIRIIARRWCANTVRIQASPDALFSGPARTDHINLAWVRALKREVHAARRLGLNVVLSAQTEHEYSDGVAIGTPLPTRQIVRYWKYLGKLFKHDQNMFFDIFNEPRLGGWHEWFYGDKAAGYIGMNRLVSDIRRDGIHQLLWVEGPGHSEDLARAARYHFSDPHGIVYAIHHPAGPHDVAQWAHDFGNLARHHAVVIGEWTQYASRTHECWDNATSAVPQFLSYVHKLHLGLIAWSLAKPGALVSGGLHSIPTTMYSDNYRCEGTLKRDPRDQGAGLTLMRWFYANNTA